MSATADLPIPISELRNRVAGAVLVPEDTEYPELAAPWNVAVSSAPAAIVRVESADDVATVVQIANDHGLRVDVRATGHGAYPDDGSTVLVHTVDLDEVVVHEQGWARVGAGVWWGTVLEAAAPLGFGALCGSSPGVGVIGFLTGGGIGPVSMTYGVGSDHVRAFEVVTGDGTLRRVTPESRPDLFRALCGGKGAAGIVTAVEIDLFAQPTVYGGSLNFDGSDGAAVMREWRRWSETLPKEATTALAVVNLPPRPEVPEVLRDRRIVAVRYAWTGDPAAGEAALAPMRAVAPTILDDVHVMPYSELGSIHDDPVDPTPILEHGLLFSTLDDEAMAALFSVSGPVADNPDALIEVRALGGAVARRPARGDVFSHRDARYTLVAAGNGLPGFRDRTVAHMTQIATAMAPWTREGALPNVGGAATPDSVRYVYEPPTLTFLAQLIATYDPRSVLIGGDAIRAAAEATKGDRNGAHIPSV